MKKNIFICLSLIIAIITSGCKLNENKSFENTTEKTDLNTSNDKNDINLWDSYSNCINSISDNLMPKYLDVITCDNINNVDELKNTLIDIVKISSNISDNISNFNKSIKNELFKDSVNLTYNMINDIKSYSELLLKSLEIKDYTMFNENLVKYIESSLPILTSEYNNKIDLAKNSVFDLNESVKEINSYDLKSAIEEAKDKYSNIISDGVINKKKLNDKKNNNTNNNVSHNINSLKMKYGEFLSSNVNEDTLVVKAKIKPSYNNKSTIDQNYYNVEDIIKNQGGDSFNEIQYWAISDMNDGSESKVISFTLNSDLINNIKEGKVVANKIGNYVDDLWILPSLLNKKN